MNQVKRKVMKVKKKIQKNFGRSYVLGLKRHIIRIEEALDKEGAAHMDTVQKLNKSDILWSGRLKDDADRFSRRIESALNADGRVVYAGGKKPETNHDYGELKLTTKHFAMGYPPLKPGDTVILRAVVSNFQVHNANAISINIKPGELRVLEGPAGDIGTDYEKQINIPECQGPTAKMAAYKPTKIRTGEIPGDLGFTGV